MNAQSTRIVVLVLLAALMAATRLHHFGAVPDASWAVFFLGGFYLRNWTRWAFPLLMALAVVVDYVVISGQGINFWSHYCVSPAYWFLVPAYFTMWAGGMLLRRHYHGASLKALGLACVSLFAAVVACHLLSQGSFYWISSSVAEPTVAGWWKNYSDWFLPYLQAAAIYVGLAAVVQVGAEQASRLAGRAAGTTAR